MNILQLFEPLRKKKPTALLLACDELEEAQIDLLTQSHAREYHSAMESMLTDRISRLKADISRLMTAGPSVKDRTR